ncbi:hypothetical protein COW99_03950 [Candidatus Roizmanbacteria bacterium CG22_combo_CG10-13_8_21_14_all_38_20]|uniref:Cytidyltransferase-like domain-containing protein n=1 Tax=Candidatus Roizmanbacteria bacterium CG22_combo_CG10-13_8_21_14_all_38_20 TaxID=1974862 RepID=A0A2H0BUS1_9BACT|nr:adenylyltransferase/cytidyltransferase family protein [Candidatus Microgenomates bacterium]PIP61427.1 MAG: hypothetical protein COW99_03950 [Candidatus Roizmanbacteria bacterium CG22_combo_CG10-13_8_21_14_all_38_20]PJC32343.1 MAG: hypothetical protein CO050_00260 [Candidatus Roizmanbacteria bacterium CG_4_9_14_0_2_um_filter_38_17]
MQKYKVALIVGRFQPFHKGHRYLILEGLKQAEKVIIGIGSINQDNKDNPIGFEHVKSLLETFFKEEKLEEKLVGIYGIPDFFNDKKWGDFVEEKLSPFDVIISNNDWTNRILKAKGYPIIEVPFFKRELYEGRRIRNLFRTGKSWMSRVPKYLAVQTKKLLH